MLEAHEWQGALPRSPSAHFGSLPRREAEVEETPPPWNLWEIRQFSAVSRSFYPSTRRVYPSCCRLGPFARFFGWIAGNGRELRTAF